MNADLEDIDGRTPLAEPNPRAHPTIRGSWPLAQVLLPALVFPFRNVLAPWVFMWLLAFAIFMGCKWFTWRKCGPVQQPWRNWAYFLAWPGLDARRFLHDDASVKTPSAGMWVAAGLKTLFGATLLWGMVRTLPASSPLLRGWCGLVGLSFVIHFGTFHLLALAWQGAGVTARPLMRVPVLAQSLGEFWGKRWNAAFNQVAFQAVFRPAHRRLGRKGATLAVFFASGLVHELVISVPARAGYGLPTLYFLLQGAGVLAEHSRVGRRLGLRHGIPGWCFTVIVTAAPVYWLFHPPFIRNVILPMLRTIGAT